MDRGIHVADLWRVVIGRLQAPGVHRDFEHAAPGAGLAQVIGSREVRLIGSVGPIHRMTGRPVASGNRGRIAAESESLNG